jgi:hypothetical protein
LDEKENIAELHPSFVENRHESSNRRPVILDAKHQPVHPCQSINPESKPDINTVKKEDSMYICNGVGGSSTQQPHDNISKMQEFFAALRLCQTSRSSFEPVLLPVRNESDEIGKYWNSIKSYYRVPDINSRIQDRNDKDETRVAASVTGNNHNSNNNVMSSILKEFETQHLNQSFATKMSASVSQTTKSASTMDEQVRPLENGISSACSSLFMSEHHYLSEEKKEEKKYNFRNTHQRERKQRPQYKGCGKEKAVRSAKCKFIWKSALAANGLKMKIWKESVVIPQKAVRNQHHARGKKKVNLRARSLRQ